VAAPQSGHSPSGSEVIEVEDQSLHVEVRYEGGMYWAQVNQWPGCFATGETLSELTEALEEAVDLYATPEEPGEEELRPVRLHILKMELTVSAERPLVPRTWDVSDESLPQPPPTRDPHQRWHLRGFHRRGEA
jgi:predicted RNase H-like HicB family nuclease